MSETEEWRAAIGYEGRYEVSSIGRVRSLPGMGRWGTRKGRVLRPGHNGKKYLIVHLCASSKESGTKQIHQLVAAAFLGPCPPGKQVNHKDAIKENNHFGNLEYMTSAENTEHAGAMGLHLRGSRAVRAKLEEADIPVIRQRLANGESQRRIARDYHVSKNAISGIGKRRTWVHVE